MNATADRPLDAIRAWRKKCVVARLSRWARPSAFDPRIARLLVRTSFRKS